MRNYGTERRRRRRKTRRKGKGQKAKAGNTGSTKRPSHALTEKGVAGKG